ncbi:hypothetical protein LPJ53_002131 [Coemansia erecta]|uniref:CBM21 domain-containing protein n=1 Tax=Coemansia erecta TaxID=147472 RepID=A0A9W8CS48_9FUNG|nr:hypothetical protein LPJ53_002131 [Coemansia erecta]
MYIPASTSTFLQTARGSPMSCSASTAAAEKDAAMYINNNASRHPTLPFKMQPSGARRASGFGYYQQQHQQLQQKKKPAYCPPSVVRKDSGEIVRPCLRRRSATTSDLTSYHQQQQQHRQHQQQQQYSPDSGDRTAVPGSPNGGLTIRTPRFVHFGADLECVRWFLKAQSPRSARKDATADFSSISDDENPMHAAVSSQRKQPSTVRLSAIRRPNPGFSIYEQSSVVLERVELSDNNRSSATIRGTVKVHNIAFEKSVVVRYSFDQWRSVHEAYAVYSRTLLEAQSGRPGVDRFSFTMSLPASVTVTLPATVAICVRYNVAGGEHWDNNNGANYMFKLAPPAAPAIVDDDVDMDSVLTTRNLSRASSSSSDLYMPRRLTFGDHSQQPQASVSEVSTRRGSFSGLEPTTPPSSPTFATPTLDDTRRYMEQSAALFGSAPSETSSSSSSLSSSSSSAAEVAVAVANNLSSSALATQTADECPSPPSSAYMQQSLCTLQPELPLYQDVAWCGGDFGSSYMASAGAAPSASTAMAVPFAYAPTTYYGGSGSDRLYSSSFSAVSPPPSEYLSQRPLSAIYGASSASTPALSGSSAGFSSSSSVAVRTGSPLATPMRTDSPIRRAVFDSDGSVRTGSPLAWSHSSSASILQC